MKDEFGVPHISTGDILRAAVAEGTELGRRAKAYMDRGDLVPDEAVVAIVAERLGRDDCRKGWLLDGFPRTAAQAAALERTIAERNLSPVDRVIYLRVPREVVVERLSGRRVCPNPSCGAPYHVESMPPKVDGVCDRCGAELIQRDDDKSEAVRQRRETYERQTAELVDRYRRSGVLAEVDASGSPDEVAGEVLAALQRAEARG
jgi:adenylate kinase